MSRDLFDETWYLRNNPDVAEAVEAGQLDAWTHFDAHGRFEGRSPSPFFDPDYYLAHNADVADAVEQGLTTAYDHFLQHGAGEGRSFVPYFDAEVYLQNNVDVAAAVDEGHTSAVQHFLTYGQAEIRTISPAFDMAAYLEANPDVADAVAAGASPLAHVLTHGFAEGRSLGNGVSLTQFANDPTFQEAMANSDPFAALARVAEVAPFIPTFEAPEGWEAPADTPIPVDFVPVEGEKLVVPPSVEVPDDVELPEDVFEPVDPGEPDPGDPDPGDPDPGEPDEVTHEIGVSVSEAGRKPDSDDLWTGSGNLPDNFSVATTSQSALELALKGYARSDGDVNLIGDGATYDIGATDRAGFVYSLAALEGATLNEKMAEGYSFYLNIDTDPDDGVDPVTLKLMAEESPPNSDKPNDSGYEWVEVGGERRILDDEGGPGADPNALYAAVTQNIQSPIWYGDGLEIGTSGVLRGGDYTISLQAFEGEENLPENLVAEQSIVLDVDALDIDYGAELADFATNDDGNMFVGSGNLATGFAVHQLALEEGMLEIALGAQERFGEVYEMDEAGVVNVSGGTPTFKFSVALDGEGSLADLLQNYDIQLLVDTDASAATEFIVLDAVESDNPDSSGALDWEFQPNDELFSGEYRLEDDSGNDSVSQNIQAFGWLQPGEDGGLYPPGDIPDVTPGTYSMAIQVFEKDTVQLVGATEMLFEIQA